MVGRKIATLTALEVKHASNPGYLCDGYGLYLQVAKGGSKTWVFRYRVNGKLREMGLGSIHTLSLAEARERARECRKLRLERKDPIEERRAQHQATALAAAKAMSFRQCAEAYISAHKAGWRNPKHASQWPATLAAYVYPVFGDPPVQAVDTGLVMKAIEPIWNEKPETASRVRGRIESVLDWAAARGYRRGENPARWRGHLDQLLPAPSKAKRAKRRATGRSEHHPAMSYNEIAAFMEELAGRHGNAARALEFTILTAKRTEEVIGARHREFNLTEGVWTIPAGRMKGEREHRVSLSAAAVVVLTQMEVDPQRRPDVFVFPGAKSGHGLSNMAMLKLLQKGMNRPDCTVHGFRSTFRDWGAERTNFPNEVLEMALAHVVDDKVEGAYRRGDLFAKRRQLADAWARYCAESARAGDDNVVAIGHHTHSAELA